MTEEDLHDEIDELAGEIECSIAEAEQTNEKYDEMFDSKHRRMATANVNVEKLFS